MDFVFRTDSSREIGSGHVMRCLTLANALKEKGHRTLFICRNFVGNIGEVVRKKGHEVVYLPDSQGEENSDDRVTPHAAWLGTSWQHDAEETVIVLRQQLLLPIDWLVVDHYAIDARWETVLRPFTKRIMVIDDLADRPHDCDLLLDQNLYENMITRYDGLVPPQALKLLGPRFALLRPEFNQERQKLRQRDGSVRRIFVFFGGSDLTNETLKALKAIKMLNRPDIAVDVVVGGANPHKEEVFAFCRKMPQVTLHCEVDNMAELMAQADLAIGAGGTATWERCCLGLPTIILVLAYNQYELAYTLAKKGIAVVCGLNNQVTIHELYQTIVQFIQLPCLVKEYSNRAWALMDVSNPNNIVKIMESWI